MSFLPIEGYEGLYDVDKHGLVRSRARRVQGIDGTWYSFPERYLKSNAHKDTEYFQVSLWKANVGTSFYVHRLVAITHIPNPNNLPEVNHIDGNRQNNYWKNLEWATSLGNKLHAIRTGLRVYTNRLTYAEFVECLQSVIAGESYPNLSQRVPYKVPFLSVKLRKIAQELGIEHELDLSIKNQRTERARLNGAKNF